jgi:tetratricopeptide (TPR) repeat protein
MLSRLFTIVLLALASLRVNATSLTGVIITNEATSSSAVDVVAIDQVHTTIRSALADTVGGAQNQTEEARREALKTYRELAEKEPETYLPDVAATLNDLGILDSDQNRIEKARKEFEEALKTYRELAHKEPDIYLRYVAITLNNLGILEGTPNRLEEALKIYRELVQKERETYLPYVAITLNNLGMLDSGKNRMNEARKEYAEVLKIYRDLAQKEGSSRFSCNNIR